jgi:hypothetical protein
MIYILKSILSGAILLFGGLVVQAKIIPASPFQDHMVLQQGGWFRFGEKPIQENHLTECSNHVGSILFGSENRNRLLLI